jgi:phytoene/squalene synthetase
MEYCRYSASPVGRQLIDLHGESVASYPASDALCSALQVLNHLQDCGEDYRDIDRVYLPRRDLESFGATIPELSSKRLSPAMRNVLDCLLDGTDRLIATAEALPGEIRSFGLSCECAVIVTLAKRLSNLLRAGDPLATRVKLGKGDFAAALGIGLWRGLVERKRA